MSRSSPYWMDNKKYRKQSRKCIKELRRMIKWLQGVHARNQGVTRPIPFDSIEDAKAYVESSFDHEPRCCCGHLFEICPQADCANIAPLDIDAINRTIEADMITAEVTSALTSNNSGGAE